MIKVARRVSRLVPMLTALFPVLAAAQINLPGSQPGDLVNWELLPTTDCEQCHADYVAGLDYEPFDSWAGSMMANSARDPLFWAAVDIANQDEAGSGEFCIRCHSPRGWLGGRSSTPDGSALEGFPDERDGDFEGIDCHFCHRMYEGPAGSPYTENGQYWVDDGTPTQEPPRRGPYAVSFAPHPTTRSDYHSSSEFCGACHDLRNPLRELLDESGVSTGRTFPEQTTYTEWTQSAFATEGTTCQDCHMPAVEVNPAFACSSFNPPRPDPNPDDDAPVFRHDLVGANTFIPQVLAGEYGVALGRSEAYQATIDRAIVMLQEQSATVEVTAVPGVLEGDTLEVDVRVTNLSGHKLPTGYPEGRRMWLEIVASDALGASFFVSGAYDDSAATLVPDAQLRTYESEHGVHTDGPGFHLVLNDRIFTDTRIPPRGFRPDLDTAPRGRVYPLQPDSTLAHWDDVSYSIPIAEGIQGPVNVSATLRYQTASREYIEFLRDENVSGPDPKDRDYPNAPSRGEKIHQLWAQYGKSAPVDMVTQSVQVTVLTPPPAIAGLNARPSHGGVDIEWDPPAVGVAGVKILRKAWMDYPEFGSASSGSPEPTTWDRYEDAIADGWVEIFDALGTSWADTTVADRAVVAYAAYSYGAAGAYARASAGAHARATNYRLGDIGDVSMGAFYDGLIDGVHDLPVLSIAYGSTEGDPGWNPEVDIAPTDDGTRRGIPIPDDRIDFSDLLVFALQFGTQEGASRVPGPAPDLITLRVERQEGEAGRPSFRVRIGDGGQALRALRVSLEKSSGWRIETVDAGALVIVPHFAATTSLAGESSADLALLGPGARLDAKGELLRLTMVAPDASSDPRHLLLDPRRWSVYGHGGQPLAFQIDTAEHPAVPASRAVLDLSANVPNPFNPRTTLQLSVARPGQVTVGVYDLAGRNLCTLFTGEVEVGTYPLVWDGKDRSGREVSSGVYLAHATGLGVEVTRRMVLLR